VRRHKLGVTSAAIILLLTAAAALWGWKYRTTQAQLALEKERSEGEVWVREYAIPNIRRLVADKNYAAAFELAQQAERHAPDDPTLAELRPELSSIWSLVSEPAGAEVFGKPFGVRDADWKYLGQAPLQQVRLPRGLIHWKLAREGSAEVEGC